VRILTLELCECREATFFAVDFFLEVAPVVEELRFITE
jgi:hypothetical protein